MEVPRRNHQPGYPMGCLTNSITPRGNSTIGAETSAQKTTSSLLGWRFSRKFQAGWASAERRTRERARPVMGWVPG